MQNQKKLRKKYISRLFFVIISIIVISLVVYKHKIIPHFKKVALTAWLNTPTLSTIYEKNNNNFSKTKIDIPKEKDYLIAVFKDSHKLQLLKNNQIIKEYNVNIKREKENRKIWEDDQTPEGIFTIESMDKVTNPPWSRWMRLNTVKKSHELYKQAYTDGEVRINKFEEEHGKLNTDKALRQFNKINKDQKILRGIGIHGGGFSIYHDWTNGCVGMSDKDVIELFDILKKSLNKGIGTKVIIQD